MKNVTVIVSYNNKDLLAKEAEIRKGLKSRFFAGIAELINEGWTEDIEILIIDPIDFNNGRDRLITGLLVVEERTFIKGRELTVPDLIIPYYGTIHDLPRWLNKPRKFNIIDLNAIAATPKIAEPYA